MPFGGGEKGRLPSLALHRLSEGICATIYAGNRPLPFATHINFTR